MAWLAITGIGGVHLSPDSAQYMDSALGLRHGSAERMPALWPPLYPAMLAALMVAMPFPGEAANLLAGLSMIALLVVFQRLMASFGRNWGLQCLFLGALFFVPGLLETFQYAWSEGPFAVLVLAAFMLVLRHSRTGRMADYLAAATLVSLAVLTRYNGYALAAVFLGYTGWHALRERRSGQPRWWLYFPAAGVAVVPGALYLLRNWLTSGTLHGPRRPATLTLSENFAQVVGTFWQDIGPALSILLAVGLFLGIRSALRCQSGQRSSTAVAVTFLGGFVLLYVSAMVYAVSTIDIDEVSSRYLVPLYPCLLLLAWIGVNCRRPGVEAQSPRGVLVAAGVLAAAAIALDVGPFADRLGQLKERRDTDAYHILAGYDISPTAGLLAEAIHSDLSTAGTVYATVFYDYIAGQTRPWMGRSLFYRRSTVDDGTLTGARFQDLRGGGFTLRLSGADWSGTILYRDMRLEGQHPEGLSGQMAEELRRILQEGEARTLLLIVARTPEEMAGGVAQLPPAITRWLAVRATRDLGPYVVYELGPAVGSQ